MPWPGKEKRQKKKTWRNRCFTCSHASRNVQQTLDSERRCSHSGCIRLLHRPLAPASRLRYPSFAQLLGIPANRLPESVTPTHTPYLPLGRIHRIAESEHLRPTVEPSCRPTLQVDLMTACIDRKAFRGFDGRANSAVCMCI